MSPFHECFLPALLCPEPFAVTSNETCVIKYPDRVVDIVEPDHPPYSLIYPGPILTTFPQQTIVGSTGLVDVRNVLAARGPLGFRGMFGSGAALNSALACWDKGNLPPFPPHLSQLFCYRTCRPA
ncbi:KRFJ protein, partial [Campylorhamphus procurvoides]|nr:KRFJ protein [Campylorhamphus procurvoides]